ncbi:MAG TPA: NAD(P)-dependent oxidoreductase [Rhodocyclaceae bacterium]
MKIGFIGLGDMGRHMAGHLLAAGHELGVWARRREAAEELVGGGAGWFNSAAALAGRSDVVITMVTKDEDVREIALGPQGLREGFARDSIHLDMSTIAPSTARDLAASYAERGVHFIDAPVSGGPTGAAAASLSIMAGGDDGPVERVMPIFEALGKTIVHIGPVGAGQVAKICNQMIMVATIEACAEAVSLWHATGVDGEAGLKALSGGSAASRALEVFGGRMVRGDFAAGVQARLHHKDYAIIASEARAMGVAMPLTAAVAEQLNALMALGFGRDDTSSLLRVLEFPKRES